MAWNDSLTTDEGIHTASGYLAMTRGEFRFDPEHPFLYKYLTALPLLTLKLNNPPNDQKLWAAAKPTFYDSWKESREWTDEWFYHSGNPARLMIFVSRLPSVLVMVFLGWFVFYIAQKWYGRKVGLLALFATAFNPTILAHGVLTNNDCAVALSIILSVYFLWSYLQKPNLKNAFYLGLFVGMAQIVKFTSIGLIPILVLALIMSFYWRKDVQIKAKHILVIFLTIWLVIWAGYLFKSDINLNPSTASILATYQEGLKFKQLNLLNIIEFIRHLLPMAYIKGLIMIQISTLLGRGAYILGHTYYPSVWFYFPVIFSIKTPLAGIILWFTALFLIIIKTKKIKIFSKGQDLASFCLNLAFITFLTLSLINKLNLGIRHILPLMPFLSIYFGLSVVFLLQYFQKSWQKLLVWLLVASYGFSVILQFPNLIGYVNILVHPYSKTYSYTADSNLDWGYQVNEAVDLIKSKYANQKIYSDYIWNGYAFAYFGVNTIRFDLKNPPKDGIIMISGSELSQDKYQSYRKLVPINAIANGLFFYKID